ncbi:A/G-specific adenine glycosylase [Zavarzinia compransoris]|uniref:Adenine DNA glycosylase n=1 Tax=Zavarzinia compransoris TaxID=1264899 RepID=A0A317EAE2_9PROT|nr:A/G-specific adenine glycosylase [Zavarzinia compransoris]PWR23532.1 A/G-specific adenine glycosylase [Zavarzinia compransoris]TDP47742.1 A/G-specific DNA-adenine glycosylase [Zavarzinia compransoris]
MPPVDSEFALALPVPAARPKSGFAAALLAWYDASRRHLPWRAAPGERSDPYRVWLSEIMLQQTTVATVLGRFPDFLERFPTVQALAAAPLEAVLATWAGLGYYARARNLHACAQAVAAKGGRFPDTAEGLAKLPGIGDYTAGAIAAIAFGRPVAAVDGNVERVMARVTRLAEPLPQAKPAIRRLTQNLVPADRPGDFAQSLMDLGATVCQPKTPNCGRCPVARYCDGAAAGDAAHYPVKAAKAARPTRYGTAYVAVRGSDGAVLLRRRPPSGLLGGMMEVPGGAWAEGAAPASTPPCPAAWQALNVAVEHTFTHFHLVLTVMVARVGDFAAAGEWHRPAHIGDAGVPTVFMKVLRAAGVV